MPIEKYIFDLFIKKAKNSRFKKFPQSMKPVLQIYFIDIEMNKDLLYSEMRSSNANILLMNAN